MDIEAKRSTLEAQLSTRLRQAGRAAELCATFCLGAAVAGGLAAHFAVNYDDNVKRMAAPHVASALSKDAIDRAKKHESIPAITQRAELKINILFAGALLASGVAGYNAQKYARRSRKKFKRVGSIKRHLRNLDHE